MTLFLPGQPLPSTVVAERDAALAELEELEAIAEERRRRHAIEARRGEIEMAAGLAEAALAGAQDDAQRALDALLAERAATNARITEATERLVSLLEEARSQNARHHAAALTGRRLGLDLSHRLAHPTLPRELLLRWQQVISAARGFQV